MRHSLYKVAVDGVVHSHMITAAVGAEMVLHRCLGVGHCQVVQQFVATVLCSPEHHIEVHHIVHYGVVGPVVGLDLSWPTQDSAHYRVEQRGKRVGRGKYYILILLRVVKLIALAIRAEHKETNVVVVARLVGYATKRLGISLGGTSYSLVARCLIGHPQYAGPKTVAPLLRLSRSTVPSLLLVAIEDVAWLHRKVVGAVLTSQLVKSTVHLCAAILQLAVDVQCLGVNGEWSAERHCKGDGAEHSSKVCHIQLIRVKALTTIIRT